MNAIRVAGEAIDQQVNPHIEAAIQQPAQIEGTATV